MGTAAIVRETVTMVTLMLVAIRIIALHASHALVARLHTVDLYGRAWFHHVRLVVGRRQAR